MLLASLGTAIDSAGVELLSQSASALGSGLAVRSPRCAAHEATVLRNLDGLDGLERPWRAMIASGPPTPFQTFDCVRLAAAESLRRGSQLAILVVGPANAPDLIWPLAVTRRFGLRLAHWLGEPFAQYGDVISGGRAIPESIEAKAWSAIESIDVDAVILRNVRTTAAVNALLERRTQRIDEEIAPFLDCDVVRASGALDKVLRSMRRQRSLERKIGALGELTFRVHEGEDARALAEAALTMKREWLVQRGLTASILDDAGWSQVLVDSATRPGGAVSALRLNGRLVAAEIGFHHHGHYVAYLGAFASDLCAYSPGRVQMRATVDWCVAKGLSSYDLLAPDDAYKYDWSTDAARVRTYVHANNWRGRAAVFGVRLRPEVKRLYHALPPTARRMLGRFARA